jgi:hypothetical protein
MAGIVARPSTDLSRRAEDVGGPYDPHSRAANGRRPHMTDNIYRVTEIVGTSQTSMDEAIKNGVTRASQTLRNLDWFEVTQVRGHIVDGQVQHFQVAMKVGFRLDES